MSEPEFMLVDVEIFHCTENFGLMVALDKQSEDYQSLKDSSSGEHECLYKISWQSIQ